MATPAGAASLSGGRRERGTRLASQESAPRLQRFGVLKEAKRLPDFPGGGLSQVNDRVALLALTTVWESTRALATDDHGQVAAKRALMRRAAVRLMVDQPLEWPKGSTWLLDGANGRFMHARYLPHWPWAEARSAASGTWGGGTATSPRKVNCIDKYCSACTGARCSSVGVMRRAWLVGSPAVIEENEALNGRCGADGRNEEDRAPERR